MAISGVTDLRITGLIWVDGGASTAGGVPWRMAPPLERVSEIRAAFLETPEGLIR